MNLKTFGKSFVAVTALLGALLLSALPVSAQVTLTSTRITAAISTLTATTMTVASATGFTAGTTHAVIDQEEVQVTSVNGLTIGIARIGANGTRVTTHASSAIVYVGNPTYFDSVGRSGSCTSTAERVLPVLVPVQGKLFTCTGGSWSTALYTTLGGYLTMPVTSGGMPTTYSCGATSGSTTCPNTATGYTAKMFSGVATLSAGTAVISGLSPTFTSTATGACVGVDTSGASGVVAEVVISGVSSLTVNGTGAGTVSWLCLGY